jgi:hypothetical protein
MRRLLLILATLAALPLSAATRYTIDVETTGDALQQRRFRATVLVDGAHRRVDVERKETPFTYDVLLSDDGGATWIALNTPLKTWFRESSGWLTPRAHVFASWPLMGKNRDLEIRDVKVSASEEPSEPLLGYAAQKHVVRTSFAARQGRGAARIDLDYGATAIVTTTDAVDPALAPRTINLTTGVAAVDAQLEPALASIHGFPLKTVLSATRMYAGGRPQTNTVAATISDIRTVPAPPPAFERPAGYVYQEPVIAAPGRSSP